MFKNGITLLVIAAASLVSAGAALDKAHTIPKNPVVKKVTRSHGKISLTLADGTVLHTKEHVRATKVKKVLGKESQGDVDGEIIRKYKNGIVKIASKKQPVASVEQKVVKKVAPSYKQVEAEAEDEEDETSEGQGEDDETPEGQGEKDETPEGQEQDETTEGQGSESSAYGAVVDEVDDQAEGSEGSESTSGSVAGGAVAGAPGSTTAASADVDLESGESVSLTFGNHNVTLTLLQNGTLELEADDTVQYLPPADDVTVEFDGSADFEASEDETDVKHKKMALDKKKVNQKVVQNEVKENKKVVKKEVGLVEGIENKVTEFVTQLQGDSSEYFTKKSTPFLIGCGLVGALAIVVGIAAVAIGRARDHAAAAADPQSVLAESEEDEDLEAANSADASADDSESLSDAEAEEGTFANEAVVVSV